MNEPTEQQEFPATRDAAMERIAALDIERYPATRNALDGATSRLSPYITHGIITLRDVLAAVSSRKALGVQHKFVAELGWRDYFQHVWKHRGDAIFRSLHQGPLPDASYATALPNDVRHGCTGVSVIDRAVRQLYATGYLHNHVRLWLASYLVHIRKVHWRTGADWLYGHLLDGDLASNHLSWQWVAGTSSSKPYLFNAENVERFAPFPWHSRGTAIDTDYETLSTLAHDGSLAFAQPGAREPRIDEPHVLSVPPAKFSRTPDPSQIVGQDVWLVHPWALREPPPHIEPHRLRLGIVVSDFHARWPWSQRRWQFVGEAMRATTDQIWCGDAISIGAALRTARSVHSASEPHLREWLPHFAHIEDVPALFPEVDQPCASFSQWWSRATKTLREATVLLGTDR